MIVTRQKSENEIPTLNRDPVLCETIELNVDLTGKSISYAKLLINRPAKANALNESVIESLTSHLNALAKRKDLRCVVISSVGKHFSAGADLEWMKRSADLSEEENLIDAQRLNKLFTAIERVPFPTIALGHGACYGGAVGVIAACDWAFASDNAIFCLSEVKLGLIPAVIFPFLKKKIQQVQLNRFSYTGLEFSGKEAIDIGLVCDIWPQDSFSEMLDSHLLDLAKAGPDANRALKKMNHSLDNSEPSLHSQITVETIADVRSGAEAQRGLASFFSRQKAPWTTN